jgi:hypothetical protein
MLFCARVDVVEYGKLLLHIAIIVRCKVQYFIYMAYLSTLLLYFVNKLQLNLHYAENLVNQLCGRLIKVALNNPCVCDAAEDWRKRAHF